VSLPRQPWLSRAHYAVAMVTAIAWANVFRGRTPGWLEVVSCVALVGVLAASTASLGSQGFLRAVTRGSRRLPLVALTFDDGPDPATTPGVLATLRQAGARATFFVLGEKAIAAPALLRQAREQGHEVGSHAFTHRWQDLLRPNGARHSLYRTSRAIADATGELPRYFRPPYGVALPALRGAVAELALTPVGWSLRTKDGTGRGDPVAAAHRVVERVRPGDIILMHDAPEAPGKVMPLGPAMLPHVLTALAARGLSAVTVSELLAAEQGSSKDL
jgi:peptidoglycan-N-acetylglucosamine deacetylase